MWVRQKKWRTKLTGNWWWANKQQCWCRAESFSLKSADTKARQYQKATMNQHQNCGWLDRTSTSTSNTSSSTWQLSEPSSAATNCLSMSSVSWRWRFCFLSRSSPSVSLKLFWTVHNLVVVVVDSSTQLSHVSTMLSFTEQRAHRPTDLREQ